VLPTQKVTNVNSFIFHFFLNIFDLFVTKNVVRWQENVEQTLTEIVINVISPGTHSLQYELDV
jgi:hypothetical protein